MNNKLFASVALVAVTGAFYASSALADEIEYVTLTKNSGSAYDSADSGAWSDKEAPHDGADYLVPVGYTLNLPNDYLGTFGGDSLTIAGGISWGGGWGKTFTPAKPITVCEGVKWSYSSYHHTFTVNPLIVKSTAENPFTFSFGNRGSNDNVDYYYPSTFVSDAAAVMLLQAGGPTMVNATKHHLSGADFSGFCGRVVFRHGVNPDIPSITIPGTVEIGTNCVFKLTESAGESSFGGLCLRTGSKLELYKYNTHLIKISGKLEIEPGAIILPYKFKTWTNGTANFPVFELTAGAVAASGDLEEMMAGVAVPTDGVDIKYGLPHLCWRIVDAENGGKKICLGYRPIVAQLINMGWGNDAFARTKAADATTSYWSDSRYPHEGADYYNSSAANTLACYDGSGPYVFPGETLVLPYPFGLYNDFRDFTANFAFGCGGRFRAMSPGVTYHLRGTATIYPEQWTSQGRTDYGETTAAFRFNVGENSTLVIDAPISGKGLIAFGMDYEGSPAKTAPIGFAELAGDNTGYDGKISVTCWQADTVPAKIAAVFPEDAPFVPGPTSNVTLRVSGPQNLGGPRAAFAYDSLKINNECRLLLKETATFADATRGWYFPANAYVSVPAGKVATVAQTLTFGEDARVVKEDAGTLLLGAATAVENGGTATLVAAAGVLGATVADAFTGLDLSLGRAAKLGVSLRGAGIDLETLNSLYYEGQDDEERQPLKMAIDFSGEEVYQPAYDVPLLRYRASGNYDLMFMDPSNPSVTLLNAPSGYAVVALPRSAPDEDGMVTLSARIVRRPLAFSVR